MIILKYSNLVDYSDPKLRNSITTLTSIQQNMLNNLFHTKKLNLKNEYQYIAKPSPPHISLTYPQHALTQTTHFIVPKFFFFKSQKITNNNTITPTCTLNIIISSRSITCKDNFINQKQQNLPQLLHKMQQIPNSKYLSSPYTYINSKNHKNNKMSTQANYKPTNYNYYNKKALLKCGEIESNTGPRYTLLLNHPQIHHERQKTYFYNKTTQIKPEYNHIFVLFEPYLNHIQTTNIN
jgi:hypothetical protein